MAKKAGQRTSAPPLQKVIPSLAFLPPAIDFLSAHCPEGQDNLQTKQYQNKQPHLQEGEGIWHDDSMESHFTEFPGSNHCNREARCQGCQRSKKRIADPFINGHLTKLFSGQTNGTKDTVFPLSGDLIGEGGIDEVDHAKEEYQPRQRLKPSKNNPVFHFLIILMYPNGIQCKVGIRRNDRAQTVFNLLCLWGSLTMLQE